MTTFDAELKTPYSDAPTALALMRGRISAVVLDGKNLQVGQARDFRLSHDMRFVCTIDADDAAWEEFKKASLEGAALFVRDYPVVGSFATKAVNVEAANG